MLSPELQNRMSEWRRKAAEGTLTTAEMRDAIAQLRGSRRMAAETPKSASRAKKPTRSTADLLGELDAL